MNLSTFKDVDEALAWINGALRPILNLHTRDRAWIGRFKRETLTDIVLINAIAEQPGAHTPYTGQGTYPGGRLALEGFTRWQTSNEDELADLALSEPASGIARCFHPNGLGQPLRSIQRPSVANEAPRSPESRT